MISIIDEADIREYPNKVQTVKTYSGLSTDSKPTEGIANGSQFIELDSGKLYMFDKDSELWMEYGSGAKTGGLTFKPITITLEATGGGYGFEVYVGQDLGDDGVVHWLIDNKDGKSVFVVSAVGYILKGLYQVQNPSTVVVRAFMFDNTPIPGALQGAEGDLETEGNVTIDSYGVITITGDCKITFTSD